MQSSSQIITTDKPTPNFLQAGCPLPRLYCSFVATRERCRHDLVIRSREHKTDTVTGSYSILNYWTTNNVKSKHWRELYFMVLLAPSSPGVFQLCLWPLTAPGYLGGGLPCLSSVLWCQYRRRPSGLSLAMLWKNLRLRNGYVQAVEWGCTGHWATSSCHLNSLGWLFQLAVLAIIETAMSAVLPSPY